MLLAGPVVLALGSISWYRAGGRYVETDNAYLRAGFVVVSPRIDGVVASVNVRSDQVVYAAADYREREARQVQESITALDGRTAGPLDAHPRVQVNAASLADARLQLEYATIRAATDGHVGRVELHPGERLEAGEPALRVVVSARPYVEANLKETQLGRLVPGQPAEVHIDAYPGRVWRASVASISPATGAEFSLLPPENASGNWVKDAPSWQMGGGQRFLLTLASVLATTLMSIDLLIASVALPQMQGSLSATFDQVHSPYTAHPFIPRELFQDRNFGACLLVTTVTSGVFMANISVFAPMLQNVLGYPAREAGLMVAPRGLGVIVGVALANQLRRWLPGRDRPSGRDARVPGRHALAVAAAVRDRAAGAADATRPPCIWQD